MARVDKALTLYGAQLGAPDAARRAIRHEMFATLDGVGDLYWEIFWAKAERMLTRYRARLRIELAGPALAGKRVA